MTVAEDTFGVIQLVVMGHLLDDLPAAGEGFCGEDFPICESMTVLQLARRIGLGDQAEFFVMINDEHLPNEAWERRYLQPGERVVLCPPLKGG